MIKKLTYGLAAASFAALLSTTAANALIIDDFTDRLETTGGVAGVDVGGDGVADGIVRDTVNDGIAIFDRSEQILGNIIGGDRELLVEKTSGGDILDGGEVTAAVIVPGYFSHSNPATTSGTSLLRWDGVGGGDGLDFLLGGGAGVSLTAGGGQYVHISVISADIAGSSIFLTLYTDAVNYSTASVVLPNGASEHFLSLALIESFNTGGTGVDLLTVRAIELLAVGLDNFDVAVDIIEVVPEPTSLTLLGAGIMGLGYFGKRRRKA